KTLEQEMQSRNDTEALHTIGLDITDEASRENLYRFANQIFGGALELLVNNAGIHVIGPILDLTSRDINTVTMVNALALVFLTKGFFPMLLRRSRTNAIVVNISSTTAIQPWPWSGSYSAAKCFLEGATDTMRIECLAAHLPIKFTLVEPGPIMGPMI